MKSSLYKYIALIFCVLGLIAVSQIQAKKNMRTAQRVDMQQQLQNMFSDMVIKKNISQMPRYYTKDFILYSNEHQMAYQVFYKFHASQYKQAIHYRVKYHTKTIVRDPRAHRLAERLSISYRMGRGSWHKLQVACIVQFKQHKIQRMWETTYPDWSKAPSLRRKLR